MKCPTIRIKSNSTESAYIVMNEADFDPAVHELYIDPVDPVDPVDINKSTRGKRGVNK